MRQTLAEGLTSARRKLSQLTASELPHVDVSQVATELGLENEARKLAAAGLPPADQTGLTAVEAKAVQRVEATRRDCVRWATDRVERLEGNLGVRDVSVLASEALIADKMFARKADAIVGEHEHVLTELTEEAQVRDRELADFRTHHGLVRPASYPKAAPRSRATRYCWRSSWSRVSRTRTSFPTVSNPDCSAVSSRPVSSPQ